jgi:hypothetical protein
MGVSSFPKDFVVPKGRDLCDVNGRLGEDSWEFKVLQVTSRRRSFCSGGETGSISRGYKDVFRTGRRCGGSYTNKHEMISGRPVNRSIHSGPSLLALRALRARA